MPLAAFYVVLFLLPRFLAVIHSKRRLPQQSTLSYLGFFLFLFRSIDPCLFCVVPVAALFRSILQYLLAHRPCSVSSSCIIDCSKLERCVKNKENRKKRITSHNQGSQAFVTLRNEISLNELDGKECDRITFYKRTYYSEGKGWTSPVAEANYNEMQELLSQSVADGTSISPSEICDMVLRTKSGYIKWLGYAPKPIRTTNSSTQKRLEEALRQFEAEREQLKEKLNTAMAKLQ